jgi:hypothetical protein
MTDTIEQRDLQELRDAVARRNLPAGAKYAVPADLLLGIIDLAIRGGVRVAVVGDLPARFVLRRHRDISGVSGLGVVVEGVRWTNGWVGYRWRSGDDTTVSFAIDIATMLRVHGHGGDTVIEWIDTPPAGWEGASA